MRQSTSRAIANFSTFSFRGFLYLAFSRLWTVLAATPAILASCSRVKPFSLRTRRRVSGWNFTLHTPFQLSVNTLFQKTEKVNRFLARI